MKKTFALKQSTHKHKFLLTANTRIIGICILAGASLALVVLVIIIIMSVMVSPPATSPPWVPKTSCKDRADCNDHGYCMDNGACECDPGWIGDLCATCWCGGNKQGTCNAEGTCDCAPGWVGPTCELYAPAGSKGGACLSNKCDSPLICKTTKGIQKCVLPDIGPTTNIYHTTLSDSDKASLQDTMTTYDGEHSPDKKCIASDKRYSCPLEGAGGLQCPQQGGSGPQGYGAFSASTNAFAELNDESPNGIILRQACYDRNFSNISDKLMAAGAFSTAVPESIYNKCGLRCDMVGYAACGSLECQKMNKTKEGWIALEAGGWMPLDDNKKFLPPLSMLVEHPEIDGPLFVPAILPTAPPTGAPTAPPTGAPTAPPTPAPPSGLYRCTGADPIEGNAYKCVECTAAYIKDFPKVCKPMKEGPCNCCMANSETNPACSCQPTTTCKAALGDKCPIYPAIGDGNTPPGCMCNMKIDDGSGPKYLFATKTKCQALKIDCGAGPACEWVKTPDK